MRPFTVVAAAKRAACRPRERSALSVAWRVPVAPLLAVRGDGRRVVISPTLGVRLVADLRTPFGLGLFRYGVNDPIARFLVGRVEPGDAVVDGGANVGLITAALAKRVGPSGTVVAVEAAEGTRALLRRNLELNAFANVTVVAAALMDRAGSVEFIEEAEGSGTAGVAVGPTRPTRTVRATTLDDEIADQPVRLLKLDIEGAELLALRGADRLLTNQRPELVLEVEPEHLARFGHSVGELRDLLLDYGYHAEGLAMTGRGLTPVALPSDWSRPSGATENYLVRPRPRS